MKQILLSLTLLAGTAFAAAPASKSEEANLKVLAQQVTEILLSAHKHLVQNGKSAAAARKAWVAEYPTLNLAGSTTWEARFINALIRLQSSVFAKDPDLAGLIGKIPQEDIPLLKHVVDRDGGVAPIK